ncbi:MAG: dUTP diphosphatase [Bacilli bacterium]|jgi:dimeric dUTPase (all-alpha-NTP-PPase superfamily)|nr:dUTP diphosphatase [Bacilli bacterium]
MKNTIELKELYKLQSGLDARIASNHQTSYKKTKDDRLMALIVEIGELANETRCFKYWSNKGPSPRAVLLDEYADGMHFLLSLGIPLDVKKTSYEIVKSELSLTRQFHLLYQATVELVESYDLAHYTNAYQLFLNLIPSLGFDVEEVIDAYKAKLDVNYQRQNNNY